MVTIEERVFDVRDSLYRARQAVVEDAVVFDTETTGLDHNAEVVEIACVALDGTVLLDSLVRPELSIPQSATAIHGITNEAVLEAPILEDLLGDIDRLFQGRMLTSYNLNYDLRVLNQSLELACLPGRHFNKVQHFGGFFQTHWGSGICIMELFSRWHGEWSDYWGDYRFQKLDKAAQSLGVEFPEPQHRALSDAQAACEVLKALAKLA